MGTILSLGTRWVCFRYGPVQSLMFRAYNKKREKLFTGQTVGDAFEETYNNSTYLPSFS